MTRKIPRSIRLELSEREKKIIEILNFKGYDAPNWIEPFTNDELWHANLWQIKEITNLFEK